MKRSKPKAKGKIIWQHPSGATMAARPPKMRPKREKQLKARKTKRGKIKALWASYGLQVPLYRRYSGRKGIYWYLFSKEIRARDYANHKGLCMTCLKYVEKGQDQCGHFFPAANCGFDLLFHPMNNHLQHSKCNNPRFSPHAGIENTINLISRYGINFLSNLREVKSRPNQKEWSQKEYDRRIKILIKTAQNRKIMEINIQSGMAQQGSNGPH